MEMNTSDVIYSGPTEFACIYIYIACVKFILVVFFFRFRVSM